MLAIVILGAFQLPQFGGSFDGARLERMRRSPEFVGGRFENTPPQNTDLALLKTWRLYSQGQLREPAFEIPVIPVAPSSLKAPPSRELVAGRLGPASLPPEND